MRIRTNPSFNLACVWAGERARGVCEWAERGAGQVRPPSPIPCQPLLLGVSDGHFQHQLRRNLKELGVVAIGLEQERQDIEAASWGFPTLLHADLQPDPARSGHQPSPPRHSGDGEGRRPQSWPTSTHFLRRLRATRTAVLIEFSLTSPGSRYPFLGSHGTEGKPVLQHRTAVVRFLGLPCPLGTPEGHGMNVTFASAVPSYAGPGTWRALGWRCSHWVP